MNRDSYEDNTGISPTRPKPAFAFHDGGGVDDIYKTTASPCFKGRNAVTPRGDRSSNHRSLAAQRQSVAQLRDSLGSLFSKHRDQGSSSDLDLRATLSRKCEEYRKSVAIRNSRNSETSFDLSSLNYLFEEDEKEPHQHRDSDSSLVRLSMFGTDVEEQKRLLDSFGIAQSDHRLAESFSSPQIDQGLADHFRTLERDLKLEESSGTLQTESSRSTACSDPAASASIPEVEEEPIMVKVTPSLSLPLRNSAQTFQAILEGRVVVTQCYNCFNELTVVDDVELVVCSDCLVLSPVANTSGPGSDLEQMDHSASFVGIGIGPDDILTWLSEQEEQQ